MKRRDFLATTLAALAFRPAATEPHADWPGWVAVGDVQAHQAVLAAGGRPGGPVRLLWSTRSDLKGARRLTGPAATAASGFTTRLQLTGLPAGSTIHYRVEFAQQPPLQGRFRTPSQGRVRFAWGGDVAGQGWGIDEARGGMRTFATLTRLDPDFFLHSGDSIYADDPLKAEVTLPDGSLWRNRLLPEMTRPAATLDEFRAHYRYNLLDRHYRAFLARVPVVVQWDDHEVKDNWDPVRFSQLAGPARQAFLEHWPMARGPFHRKLSYGPDLDVFMLDLRSARAPDSDNRQSRPGPATRLLGSAQLDWLKRGLKASRARWKFIGGEMPIGTYDVRFGLDGWGNGDGPPLGREFELAELLSFLRRNAIENVVWLSADVHYAAALHYAPERARFKDFSPFWEFVAGPLHAGTFAPSTLDETFGPEMVYCPVPSGSPINRPPSDGQQFFGWVEVEGTHCRVSLHQQDGRELFRKVLS